MMPIRNSLTGSANPGLAAPHVTLFLLQGTPPKRPKRTGLGNLKHDFSRLFPLHWSADANSVPSCARRPVAPDLFSLPIVRFSWLATQGRNAEGFTLRYYYQLRISHLSISRARDAAASRRPVEPACACHPSVETDSGRSIVCFIRPQYFMPSMSANCMLSAISHPPSP